MTRVYKILDRSLWREAQAAGRFDGAEIDRRDGYIHLSTAAQAPDTARLHFAGRADLVVLEIVAADLGDGLRWEPSRGGQLFPHLYGTLDPSLVRRVHEAPLDAEGRPHPPSLTP